MYFCILYKYLTYKMRLRLNNPTVLIQLHLLFLLKFSCM